jgi:hypothetical protein
MTIGDGAMRLRWEYVAVLHEDQEFAWLKSVFSNKKMTLRFNKAS